MVKSQRTPEKQNTQVSRRSEYIRARLEETAMRNSWTCQEPSGRSGDGVSVPSRTCCTYSLQICSSRKLILFHSWLPFPHLLTIFSFFNLFFYWRIIDLQNFVVFLKHPCVHRFCFLSRSVCSWLLTASALLQSLLLLHKLNSSHCKLPLLSVFLNSNSWKLDGWS